jgi:hypothetical protein
MTEDVESKRVQAITNKTTAALLLNPDLMGCLQRLMEGEWTVAALAKDLGIGIGSLHYRVQQLLEHGLICVNREEKRAGRAIKHYTATASSFFVPFNLTNFETLQAFWWAILEPKHQVFVGNLVRNAEKRTINLDGRGVIVKHIQGAGLQLQSVPRPKEISNDPVSWFGEEDFQLSHEQAQAFRFEMRELIAKYKLEAGSHPYVMQAGLVWTQG